MIKSRYKQFITRHPNAHKIVLNTGWLFLDKILRMGVGLLVGVWVARYLGPARFGLLSYAGAFVALFSAIASLGVDGIAVRELVRHRDQEQEILGSTLLLKIVGAITMLIVTAAAIFILRPGDTLLHQLVCVIASITLFQSFDTLDLWFQSHVNSKFSVWAKSVGFLVSSVVKIGLILIGGSLIWFAWTSVLEAALAGFGLIVAYRMNGHKLNSLKVRLSRCKKMLSDSWPYILSGLSVMIYMKIDQVMLGEMLGNVAVGVYSAATRVSEIWYFLSTAIASSVFPAIVTSRELDEGLYYRRLQRLFSLMVALALAIALPMTLLAKPLMLLLFGNGYAASGPVLAVHIWAALFVFLGVAQSGWDVAENLSRLSLFRTAVGAVLNVLLNLVLIPSWGPLGAAVATVISYAFSAFILNAFHKKTRPIFILQIKSLLFLRGIAEVK